MQSDAAPATLAQIDGWPINVPTLATAVDEIIAAARAGLGFSVMTLNLDHLVKLRSDEAFRRAYRSARLVTADGEPVARIAQRQTPGIERTTGADLLVPLTEAAAANGLGIYLFGSSGDVLARAGRDLAERCDGTLEICGSDAPPIGFDPESAAADAAIDRIIASGARICFLALGAPKQEIFAARAVARGAKCAFICVGAALDFVVGAQIRAPKTMQRTGLEWLWRLATNPRRLAGRYAHCALLLAELTLRGPRRPAGTL
jgi:exopolysaccharide biosynthesis WecB/TagA/CpsF family protein